MNFKQLLLLRKVIMYSLYGILAQVVLCSMLFASTSEAQKAVSVKEISINVDFTNDDITTVFEKLEESTDYNFVFSKKDLSKTIRLNGNYQGNSFYDVLLNISKQANLSFQQVNSNINVKKLNNKRQHFSEDQLVQILADVDISGKISDENNQGLPGASIVVKGTTTGTTTDLDGNYKLSVPEDATIVISFVGYKASEILVGTQTVIDFQMEVDADVLNEVVVTAFGLERDKKALGYSVTQVNGEELSNVARDPNFINVLQGKVAGLTIQPGSNGLGSGTKVTIRGNASLLGNNDPLYVVDGIPMDNTNFNSGFESGNGLSSINPDNIEVEGIWTRAQTALKLAQKFDLNTSWYAPLMRPNSVREKYHYGYWLNFYLYQDMLDNAMRKGNNQLLMEIERAYYSGNWELLDN